ncbi:MAG: hypothetical protein ACI4TW_07480 [Prevotella sp.]
MNKKFLLLILALLPLLCATTLNAAKKEVVWDNVARLYNQRSAMKVTKVVFSDTATTLYAKINYNPEGKIRINKNATIQDMEGNRYALKSAEGIVPDKWRAMKKGGDEVLPATKYSPRKSVIRCKVYGHRPIMKTSISGSYNIISSKEQKNFDIPVGDDGTAVIEIEPECPVTVFIGIEGINFNRLAVVPGEDISFSMDMADGTIFDITGTLPRTQREINDETIARKFIKLYDDKAMVEGIKGKTDKEIWAFLDNVLRSQKDLIGSLDITDASKAIMRMDAEEENMLWRRNFEHRWLSANMEL